MPDPHPFTPIVPAHNSLTAHLAALDLLAARIASLPAKTRWDARIHFNGKGSVLGQVVHTNDIKVDIGGGDWVEMTAKEAAEYVDKRKTALLLEHAQMREAISHPVKAESSATSASGLGHSTHVSFNPLFSSPIQSRTTSASGKTGPATPRTAIAPPQPSAISPTSPSTADTSNAVPKTLEEIVDHFLKNQQGLQGITEEQAEKLKGKGAEALVTEDGLPIHDIREDMDGNIIGEAPTSSLSADEPLEAPTNDDYWTGDADKRRRSLWDKVFSSGGASDEEEEEEEENGHVSTEAKPVSEAAAVQTLDDSAQSSKASPPSPRPRRPSSLRGPPPRSILKAPTRKKSVSFDDSVPVPPDTPPSKQTKLGGLDFPLPTGQVDIAEFEPRPVPVIAEPKPAVKSAVGERFAGFSRGFLNKPFAPPPGPPTPPVSEDEPPVVKKPSLFAQRKTAQANANASIEELPEAEAAETLAAVSPVVGQAGRGRGDGLPLISELKPMASMKNSVIERAPEPRPTSKSAQYRFSKHAEDEDEDEDEDGDYYDDDDEDDEDEYDLDDALLAREVALDYHRRQVYNGFARRRDSDDEGDGEEREDDDGNVMMALPSISSNGRIVNPTPDDIQKYIRIGRLENGNLVLAPGEAGFSDDDEGEGDEEKKARVEQVKRQLLGQEPVPSKEEASAPKLPPPALAVKSIVENAGLPPKIATDTIPPEIPQASSSPSPASLVEVPKKVSRFKAARMGM